MWKPESSSLLQVLVSIQGLILVEKPYYNEAGYEPQAGSEEGEHNAAVYNEQALLECLKTMVNVVRNPPRHFEALVRRHFAERRAAILARCEGYLAGKPVGAPPRPKAGGGAGAGAATGPGTECSEGFRMLLGKLLPKVRAALESVGEAPAAPPPAPAAAAEDELPPPPRVEEAEED